MSSVVPPQLDASGKFLTTGYDWGTPLDYFDLQMAMAPGMSEDTRLAQLAKALAYWQAVPSTADSLTLLRQTWAITWITAEQSRVANPPANGLHIIYPV